MVPLGVNDRNNLVSVLTFFYRTSTQPHKTIDTRVQNAELKDNSRHQRPL